MISEFYRREERHSPTRSAGTVNTEPLGEGRLDTLMAGSGPDLVSPSPRTVVLLRNALSTTRRITSICIAAFTLAEAGILDGRRATTHWSYAEELARRFPKINVEMDRIFIADGPVWTSAGMTAGIDPALGLIERDLGQQAAQRTARVLVIAIIAALAVNRSIPQCCSSMLNPIAFKLHLPSQSKTYANR